MPIGSLLRDGTDWPPPESGFRVGTISQQLERRGRLRRLGRPNLFSVTAGNAGSMVNRYTSDKKIRRDDAYSPEEKAACVRSQHAGLLNRCREAFGGVPIVIGGIEASLRRMHFDYWSESSTFDSTRCKADLLLYGNAERAIVELAHRLAKGKAFTRFVICVGGVCGA